MGGTMIKGLVKMTYKIPDISFTVGDDEPKEHPIMKWLIPGEKRDKMERIVQSLKDFKQLENVSLGVVPMTTVADYLEATAK